MAGVSGGLRCISRWLGPELGAIWWDSLDITFVRFWYNDVMTWKRFPHYWPFVVGNLRVIFGFYSKGTMGSFVFPRGLPRHGVEQIIELPVIWDAMTLLWWPWHGPVWFPLSRCLQMPWARKSRVIITVLFRILHRFRKDHNVRKIHIVLQPLLEWSGSRQHVTFFASGGFLSLQK